MTINLKGNNQNKTAEELKEFHNGPNFTKSAAWPMFDKPKRVLKAWRGVDSIKMIVEWHTRDNGFTPEPSEVTLSELEAHHKGFCMDNRQSIKQILLTDRDLRNEINTPSIEGKNEVEESKGYKMNIHE